MYEKPKPNEVIYKEECLYCHENVYTNGIYVWLRNYQGYCEQHVMDQIEEKGLFLYVKEENVIESGFKKQKKLKLVEYDPMYKNFMFKSMDSAEYGENLKIIEAINGVSSVMIQQRNILVCNSYVSESPENERAQNFFVDEKLFQVSNPPKYSATALTTAKSARCFYCDLNENLWLNLSDGVIACGRKQYDGSGGNNHAVEHYNRFKYPIAVKLGTITSDGSADVFSYELGEMVTDMCLDKHLAHFDIDISQLYITESTMEQLQETLNKNLILQSKNEYAEMLSSLRLKIVDSTNVGDFCVDIFGLNNVGNSCYVNSLFQVLSAVPDIEDLLFNVFNGYLPEMFAYNLNKKNDKMLNTNFEFQLFKLFRTLIRFDKANKIEHFRVVRTNLFKQSFAFLTDNNVFAQNHQQDVPEFFSYILSKVENTKLDFGPLFKFKMVDLLYEGSKISGRVCYEYFLTLPLMLIDEKVECVNLTELLRLVCSKRGVQSEKNKKVQGLFYTTPSNLVLSIGRYNYEQEKIMTEVEVPAILDLHSYVLSEQQEKTVEFSTNEKNEQSKKLDEHLFNEVVAMGFDEKICRRVCSQSFVKNVDNALDWILRVEAGESLPENEDHKDNNDTNKNMNERGEVNSLFELYGVVVHLGRSTSVGHYIAFVRKDGQWFCFNDEKVFYMEDENFHQYIRNGYLYFYKKV